MATATQINGNHTSPTDNLAIWRQVETTDQAHTKRFEGRKGGFSGTSINRTYQTRRATEIWGPIGIGWGFDEVEHFIADGAPGDKVWFSKVRLWYLHHGERGEIEQWGATTFAGVNRNGAFTDEEAGKKSITDAVGKCLSLLGFSADVYLGLYDDDKNVNDRRRLEAARRNGKPPASAPKSAASAEGAAAWPYGPGNLPPSTATDPGKRMVAAFGGDCAECGRKIASGEWIYFSRERGSRHVACVEQGGEDAARPATNGNRLVTAEDLTNPRGAATAHPHANRDGADAPADLTAFRDLCNRASMLNDVRRAEHLLCSGRSMNEFEKSLIATWSQAAYNRIKANPRGANSNVD